ncbi:hypothetical protein HY382_02860 [Candidatus Curtissbacteria bacterium]|nr:hypothetical protein [Candidatus Curtissbacteria bacterium]
MSVSDLKPEHIQQILEGWGLEKQSEDVWNFSKTTEDGKIKRLSIDKIGKSAKYFSNYENEKTPMKFSFGEKILTNFI